MDLIRLNYAPDANPSRDQALADAALLLGRDDPRVRDFAVMRWPAVPRPLPTAEQDRLREALPENIRVAGAWVSGNGIEASIASGLEAAA